MAGTVVFVPFVQHMCGTGNLLGKAGEGFCAPLVVLVQRGEEVQPTRDSIPADLNTSFTLNAPRLCLLLSWALQTLPEQGYSGQRRGAISSWKYGHPTGAQDWVTVTRRCDLGLSSEQWKQCSQRMGTAPCWPLRIMSLADFASWSG